MNFPNFSPPPPATVNLKTFGGVRTLLDWVVNNWMQYANNYFQNQMLPLLNTSTYSFGPTIAAASTISPTALVQMVSGSTTVDTITPIPTPSGNFAGPICLIAQNGFATSLAGNILVPVTISANHMGIFAYLPSLNNGRWGVVTS